MFHRRIFRCIDKFYGALQKERALLAKGLVSYETECSSQPVLSGSDPLVPFEHTNKCIGIAEAYLLSDFHNRYVGLAE